MIQIFVFQLDRRFFLDNTVETALIYGIVLVGAAILDSVCTRLMSVMVNQTVQMVQMNPQLLAVNLPAPVIQIFVFQLDRRFFLDNTVETADSTFIDGIVLVGA